MPDRPDVVAVLPALQRFARTLCAAVPGEDHKDLVHDTVVKLLAVDRPLTEGYAIVAMKNVWRDRLAYRAVRRLTRAIEDTAPAAMAYLPSVEVEIYCREVGIDLDNPPELRQCPRCGEVKPDTEFYLVAGQRKTCNACHRTQARDWARKRVAERRLLAHILVG